jgi:hypothetical protein
MDKKPHVGGKKRPEDYRVDIPPGKGNDTTIIYSEHPGKIIRPVARDMQAGSAPRTARDAFNDSLSIRGDLLLVHKDKDGNVKSSELMQNVICYVGLKHISQMVSGALSSPFKYIWIGTGGRDPADPLVLLAPDPTNISLVAFYKEGAAVASNAEVLNNADRGYQAIARFAYTFDFAEEVHINEACISVDSHSVLNTPILNRRTFYDRVMQPTDFLEVVWEISFTRYPKDKVT